MNTTRRAPPAALITRGALLALLLVIVCFSVEMYRGLRAKAAANTLLATNATLVQQLDAAHHEASQLKTALDELKRRAIPVTLSFQKNPQGEGLVARFRNNAPTQLVVAVEMWNPQNRHHRQATLTLPAGGSQSIGAAEGWAFEAGQRVTLTTAAQGSVEFDVPQPDANRP